eukprot:6213952-Pleurochrysis_carterae.AAC.3
MIVDDGDAAEFLRAVVDSDVWTPSAHSVALAEATVALQLYKLVWGKDCVARSAFFSQTGMPAL